MNSTKLTEEPPKTEPVFLPANLKDWNQSGVSLAVLGDPIGHSISPIIHNAALCTMARTRKEFNQWRYYRFEVPLERLRDCLPIFSQSGFRGLNLTIPLKVEALGLADRIDPEALAMGAINTLVFHKDGSCEGFNTDGAGLEHALQDEFDLSLSGVPVVLLGAGGAARAAATRFLRAGCSELWIGNRTPERLARLLEVLVFDDSQRVEAFSLDNPHPDLPRGADAVVVNATSLGLGLEDAPPLDLANFADGAIAYDMIYNPSETAFLRSARSNGMRAANGLSMLIRQAACSLSIWTGHEVPVEPMFEAAKLALSNNAE